MPDGSDDPTPEDEPKPEEPCKSSTPPKTPEGDDEDDNKGCGCSDSGPPDTGDDATGGEDCE